MKRTSRTITPYRPGTRSEFMSPDLHMLSVQVDPDGTAYLFNGCMIVDTRENSADMTIPDAQRWCVDYEARAARECHEANVGAAERTEVERDIENMISDRAYFMTEAKKHANMALTYTARGASALADACQEECVRYLGYARDMTAALRDARELLTTL